MRILVALLVLASATAVCAQQPPAQWGTTVVEKQRAPPKITVIDGNRVIIDDVRWRVKGYNAPSIENAKCQNESTRGIQTKNRLEELLASAKDEIAVFPEGRLDKWLRLARLTVDGKDVGPVLIAERLAVAARAFST